MMQLKNSFNVSLSADEAWPVLTDVERVVSCMPGVTLDSVDGDDINATMKVKLGPIGLTYRGAARFVESDEKARRLVIEAAGKDTKGAGTASATVAMTLHDSDGGSEVQVVTDLNVTGKPAQFGRGALQDVSSKMIGRFAAALEDEIALENATHEPVASSVGVAGAPSAATSVAAQAPPGRRRNDDALNLRDIAGPIMKRLAPVLLGAMAVVALGVVIVRRFV